MSEIENLKMRLRHRDEDISRLRARVDSLERANEVLIEALSAERRRAYQVERIAADERRAQEGIARAAMAAGVDLSVGVWR